MKEGQLFGNAEIDAFKDKRQEYLASKSGDLTAYASMVGDEFASRIDRLAQIIGTTHEASVGAYKESVLRNLIGKFIPKRYSVGTGFVLFAREGSLNDRKSENPDLWNLKEHYVSRQLDIVVYDDYNFPPIFRDEQLVVLRPESVKCVVEVKGYLSKANVSETVDGFIDLGRKWIEHREYRKRRGLGEIHSPSMHLMGWNVYVDPSGNSLCDGKVLRQTVVQRYRDVLTVDELSKPSIPLLSGAYIYADSVVMHCGYVNEKTSGSGYLTRRGKFIRYGEDRTPFLEGDCTIAFLLAAIQQALDTPFNADYSHLDQSTRGDIFAPATAGLTDIITGQELGA
jgi:hypothetical protein